METARVVGLLRLLNRLDGVADEPGVVVTVASYLSRSIRGGGAQQLAASVEQQPVGQQQVIASLSISNSPRLLLALDTRSDSFQRARGRACARTASGASLLIPALASSQQQRLISFVRPFFYIFALFRCDGAPFSSLFTSDSSEII